MNREQRRAAQRKTIKIDYPQVHFAIAGEHSVSPGTIAHLKDLREQKKPLRGAGTVRDIITITFQGEAEETVLEVDFYAATETLLCLLGEKPFRFHFEDEHLQQDLVAKLDSIDKRNRELGRCPPRELLDGNATDETGRLSLAKQTMEAERKRLEAQRKRRNIESNFPEDFRLDITKVDRWSVRDFVIAYAPKSITPDAARQAVQRKLWEIRKELHGMDRDKNKDGQPGKAIADISKNEVEQLHHFFSQKWAK